MSKGAGAATSAKELAMLILERADTERYRVETGLNSSAIESLIVDEYARLDRAVREDAPIWKADLPGRVILNKFAASAAIQVGRLKQMYLVRADKEKVFSDVIAIFQASEKASDRRSTAGTSSTSTGSRLSCQRQ